MDLTNSANVEAICNICANLTEIVGIRYGFIFLCTSILIAFLKRWKLALSYFGLALVTTFCALCAPGIMNWVMASARDVNPNQLPPILGVLSGIFAFAVVVVGIGLLYWPVHIAKKQQIVDLRWIFELSAFSILIPFLWSIAVFLVYKREKQQMSDMASSDINQ